jgi:hypothetical protein
MIDTPVRTRAVLQREGWGPDDIDNYYLEVDKRQRILEAIEEAPNVMTKLKLKRELEISEDTLRYAGKDPRIVPVEALDRMRRAKQPMDDLTTANYREKIKTRASSIRAFCVDCQGGEIKGVRECEAMNCPLWPFRMGTDPLRGKVRDIVMDEAPLVDETGEIIIEEEDTDDDEPDAKE